MRRVWHMLYAARFVAKWEGWLPSPYLDRIASPPVWTQGYGDTQHVEQGTVWSKAKGLQVLAKDLHAAAKAVREGITAKLTFRQRIAFISIAFNCGPGAVVGSEIAKAMNAGHTQEAAMKFLDWAHAGGVIVEGLLNRRKAESWMVLHPGKPTRKNPHRAKKQTIKGPAHPHHQKG